MNIGTPLNLYALFIEQVYATLTNGCWVTSQLASPAESSLPMPLFGLHLISSFLRELNPTVIQCPPSACVFGDINQDFAMPGPSAHESVSFAGMSVGAAWRLDKLEQGASGKNTQLVRDEVSIIQEGYVCVRQLKSNFSELC